MARFHVYLNRDDDPGSPPLLLDVQSDLLSHLPTRVVVPLMPEARFPIVHRRLHPILMVDGKPFVMVTTAIIGIDARLLGREVGSLEAAHSTIVDALDFVFQGY